MTTTRTETDSMGPIEVEGDRLWGAQTQRSLQNFKIGGQTFPRPMIRALGVAKKCAAQANIELGELDSLPEDEQQALLRAAEDGSLHDPEVLAAQAERMLASDRLEAGLFLLVPAGRVRVELLGERAIRPLDLIHISVMRHSQHQTRLHLPLRNGATINLVVLLLAAKYTLDRDL